jgi:hypothetical protein
MKKIITLLSIILIVSSCSNKFSLQKRKYNKGFYFASNHSKNNSSNTGKLNPQRLNSKSYSQVKIEQQELEIASENNKNVELTVMTNPASAKIQPNLSEVSKNDLSLASNNIKHIQLNKLIRPMALPMAKKGGSDTNLIVLVILSLFPIICLIAVFLKDSKSITLNFWIDLLLHVTLIGAIIFALLVVLDIVNLA